MAAFVGWLWPLQGPIGTVAVRGPLEEVGLAMLLALVFLFWAARSLRERKPQEEQRAAENRRTARRLYEERVGLGRQRIRPAGGRHEN